LLLKGDGTIKIGDFGIAAIVEKTMCDRNTVTGSPYWMSPELI